MNKDTNKRGKGRPQKRKGVNLHRITYIQDIISRAEFGAASRAATRVRSHMRSGGQISQLEPPLIGEVQFGEEEVASKGYEELHIASLEEEDLREFLAPFDQGSVVKQPPPQIHKPY